MKSVAYEAVYNQIINTMEKGTVPWQKSWTMNFPRNAKTGRKYSGVNFFLLSMLGYADPRWLTFNQVKELKGNVKKGEKATQVVFWTILSKDDNGKKNSFPLLRYFNVWNVEQCENLTLTVLDEPKSVEADSVLESYADKPKVGHGFQMAAYSVKKDEIMMPSMGQFTSANEYYATLFHELTHSTGHKDRLNRKTLTESDGYGAIKYSEEELVAEFGAAFLCASVGIDNTVENSSSYIKGWMKSFKDNPEMIIHAASKAQKAVDYIMGVKTEENS